MTNITEIAEQIATNLDGRTVTSHAHYRELLVKELVAALTTLEATHQQELEEAYQRGKAEAPTPAKTKWYALEPHTKKVLDEDENLFVLHGRMLQHGIEAVYSQTIYLKLTK